VDIQLIAVAYQLTKEKLGPDASARLLKTELDADSLKKITVMGTKAGTNVEEGEENVEASEVKGETEAEFPEELVEGSESSSSEQDEGLPEEEEEDDDEEGWITPSNYKEKIKELNASDGTMEDPNESTPVACLTNDFSMQVTRLCFKNPVNIPIRQLNYICFIFRI